MAEFSERDFQLLRRLSMPYNCDAANVPSFDGTVAPADFAHFAVRHKVYPTVLQNLRLACEAQGYSSPYQIEVQRHLEPFVFRWHVRLRRLKAAIEELRRLLAQESVPFLFLRGICFAEDFYPSARFRTSNDVDLLIRPEQLSQVVARLRSLNYAFVKPEAFRAAQLKCIHQVELTSPEGILVDVNCMLAGNGRAGGFSKDMDLIWSNATKLSEYEYRMSTGDTLLHILRHVSQGHEFEEGVIRGCADVEAIMAKDGAAIDWPKVRQQASECRALRAVSLYAGYFDETYRAPSTSRICSKWGNAAGTRDHFVFQRFLIKSRLNMPTSGSTIRVLLHVNLCFLFKFFMAQDFKHLMFLYCRGIIWPSNDLLVLLDGEDTGGGMFVRRVRVWAKMLLCFPGTLLGVILRVLAFW